MTLLLDTHAFLWFIEDDERLSDTARDAIVNGQNRVLFSIASGWEMAIKVNIGKLRLAVPYGELLPAQVVNNGMFTLEVQWPHLWYYYRLPLYHRDPFDRMLVAQTLCDGLTLVSEDSLLDQYEIQRL